MRAAARAAPPVSTGQVVDRHGRSRRRSTSARRVGVGRLVVVDAAPGAVPLEPVADVEVLLEVVAQRDVDERAAVGGELHARRQAALHDRQVARREVAVELGDVAAVRHAATAGQRPRVDARPGDDDEAQAVDEPPGRRRRRRRTRRSSAVADAGAADGDDAHPLVGPVAELGRAAPRGRRRRRVEARDVAGELEVLLGPLADRRQPGAERVGRRCRRDRRRRSSGRGCAGSGRAARSSRRCSRRSARPRASPPSGIGSHPTKSVIQANANRLSSGFSWRK